MVTARSNVPPVPEFTLTEALSVSPSKVAPELFERNDHP
jgi:hypothetical protein